MRLKCSVFFDSRRRLENDDEDALVAPSSFENPNMMVPPM